MSKTTGDTYTQGPLKIYQGIFGSFPPPKKLSVKSSIFNYTLHTVNDGGCATLTLGEKKTVNVYFFKLSHTIKNGHATLN